MRENTVTDIAEAMPRIRALLDLNRYGEDVSAGDAKPPAAEVGALDATAFRWSSQPVTATVFAFADGPSAMAAWAVLHEHAGDWPHAAGSANGGLLLWAAADADTDATRDLVEDLCSSFAGDE